MEKMFVDLIKLKSEKVGMDILGVPENNTSFLKCSFDLSLPEEAIKLEMYVLPETEEKVDIHISPFNIMRYDNFYATDELINVLHKVDSILKVERINNSYYYKGVAISDFVKILEM